MGFLNNLIPELPQYDRITYTKGSNCINICREAGWDPNKYRINLYIAHIYYCIYHNQGKESYYLSLRTGAKGFGRHTYWDYYLDDPDSLTNLKSGILEFLRGYDQKEPPGTNSGTIDFLAGNQP